jgi:hypothetical protein
MIEHYAGKSTTQGRRVIQCRPRRWPVLGSVSPWVFASAVTAGALLAPLR